MGRQCLYQALQQGHSVKTLARFPDKYKGDAALDSAISQGRLTIVQGDALVQADVEKTVEDCQVIITSLGGKLADFGHLFALLGFTIFS